MSWLPSNYSLNSIKDQFSNLAGELLNEIRDEKDGEQGPSNTDSNHAENAVSPSRVESKIISDLKSQIQCLENEKQDLISSLEQLDIDNQQNVEKIIKYKDTLQGDLQMSQINYNNLKQEYDKLKEWSISPEDDTEDLIERNNDLVDEVFMLKKNCETSKLESQKLLEENKLLRNQVDTNHQLLQDETISQVAYKKLETILQEYEKRVRNYETELQELQQANANAVDDHRNSESQSLQNIVESSNKIIESKNAIIKDLEQKNLELEKNKLQSCDIEKVRKNNCDQNDNRIANLQQDLLKLSSENLTLKNQVETSIENTKNFEDLRTRNQELDTKMLVLHKLIEKLELDKNVAENQISLQEVQNLKQQKLLQDVQEENVNLTDEQEDLNQRIYTEFDDSTESISNFKKLTDVKSKVNLVIKFFTDLKSSQSKLQNEIRELSDQNQKSILEIEELTQNSSTFKQELVNKNIEFEEFEAEYNELLKSNDLILAELNSLKSNNLVTIPEANEDNMLQLENDLENANSKIKELEVILDCEKSRPQSSEPFEMLQKSYEMVNVENQDLQKALDKYKLEYENLDYKLNEQKAQIDALQEDLLSSDKHKISLEEENNILASKLQELGDAYKNIYDDFIEQKSRSLQDIKSMREKLQGAKMAETSLKLQNELHSKEIIELKKSTTVATDLQQKLDMVKAKSLENEINFGKVVGELESEIKTLKEQVQMKNESFELKEVSLADQQNDQHQEMEDLKEKYYLQAKHLEDVKEKYDGSEKQLENLNSNREELIAALNSKHEESLNYYQQIQKLQKHLLVETDKCKGYELQIGKWNDTCENNDAMRNQIERLTDQNDFLKDKCDKMTETLMHEQSSAKKQLMDGNEREQSLSKELERLRQHLLEIEEMYTKELLNAEQKTSEMQSKVNVVEQREKNSNNVYTSVSIRSNQQVETLQTQLQLVTNQRDEIRNKLSDNEDQINKQAAALMNLQCVLQQFQKDKQKDIHNETDRIRRQIAAEKTTQADLQKEIGSLKQQLQESKEGLQAAARLTDQLEEANKTSSNTNNELIKLRAVLNETEKKYEDAMSQPDAKVDKTLVRNLIIGLISSNNNLSKDQHQVLKIIATVLDFSQQDNDKLQMNKSLQSSWINSLLHPAHQNMSQESLSLAFVKFLENESKPRNLPSLLDNKIIGGTETLNSSNAKSTHMNEMVLPTFNDYGQRSSSSILKDALKENH